MNLQNGRYTQLCFPTCPFKHTPYSMKNTAHLLLREMALIAELLMGRFLHFYPSAHSDDHILFRSYLLQPFFLNDHH